MKIGDKIRAIREKEKNLTQAYVASRLEVTPKAYGNIENNISSPTISRLEQIAEIFECDINYIINYEQGKGGFYNNFYNHSSLFHQGNIDLEKLNQLFTEMKKMYDEVKDIVHVKK